MLQVTEHVIKLDHAIADFEVARLVVADRLAVLVGLQVHVVEVHASTRLLDPVDHNAVCRPHHVGVVMFVLVAVRLVELPGVLHRQNQINRRRLLQSRPL